MMIPAFPLDDFEEYIQWLCEVFGHKKMFLSLEYSTLHLWFQKYLYVTNFQEVHQLILVPPQVLLSTFGYAQAKHHLDDLIELMIIIHYINHQLDNQTAFPWSLESYFAFRMNQYPITKAAYQSPRQASQISQNQAISQSHFGGNRNHPGSYHTTPPRMLSHHDQEYVSMHASQQGGYRNKVNTSSPSPVTSYVDRMNRQQHNGNIPVSVYTPRSLKSSRDSEGSHNSRSLQDEVISIRRRRNEEYARLYAPPKVRNNIASDKLQWDGHRASFMAFANDLEGNMIRVGLGYMFEAQLQADYDSMGLQIAHRQEFWKNYRISYQQLKQDSEYLYGLLKSATKNRTNPFIMRHKNTRDGLSVWIAFQKTYVYGGSEKIRSNELEERLLEPYNSKTYKGIAQYIDEFQSWVEELDGLGTRSYKDDDKKRMLLRNLVRVPNIAHLLQTCEDSTICNFEDTCNYIRSNSMVMDKMISTTPRPSMMLNTSLDNQEEPNHEDIIRKIQIMMQETSPIQVYQVLQSPTMRENLNIPTALWVLLEPKLKERIMELRAEIRKKKGTTKGEHQQKAKVRNDALPPQYANMTSMDLVANICSQMTQQDSDEDTDDGMLRNSYCATTVDVDKSYKAHLEYAKSHSTSSKTYAISDGGADACVVGSNAFIASYSGRHVHLTGYDPNTTKSHKVPIVTAYLKVKGSNGVPLLLKINEAVYNAGSPITLLSEYQIRENGYIVDSVATKHRTGIGSYGTQRIVLNDSLHLPFVDRGGLMGFEILPIHESELDNYDTFELTCAQKWVPARFCTNEGLSVDISNDMNQVIDAKEEKFDILDNYDILDTAEESDVQACPMLTSTERIFYSFEKGRFMVEGSFVHDPGPDNLVAINMPVLHPNIDSVRKSSTTRGIQELTEGE